MDNTKQTANAASLVALLTVTIWGTNFVFQKALLSELGEWPFLFVRFLGMLALGWVIVGLNRRRAPEAQRARFSVQRADLPRLALSGVLGYTLYITLSAVGLAYTSAFSSALLIAVAPVFMALLLLAMKLERPTTWQWLGMAVSVAGVFVFLGDKLGAGFGSASFGDLISLAGAFFYAAYNVANKPLLAKYPATLITAVTLSIGVAPILLVAAPSAAATDWAQLSPQAWAGLVWSIVFPVYLAWTMWSWAGARLGVSRTAVFMYLVPLVSGACAAVLLGEPFTVAKIAGAVVVIGGLALARRKSQPKATSELHTQRA